MKRPYSHYSWEQIKESGLLSDDRTAEVEKVIHSRIHPVHLPSGKEVPNAKFFDFGDGTGILQPLLDHDPEWTYAIRLLIPHILTVDEMDAINKLWWSATTERQEAERFEKAEKLTEWDGAVFLGDDFCTDMGEAMDRINDYNDDEERPKYVWAAKDQQVVDGADVSDVLERFIEANGWEDMDNHDFEGVEELQEALERFRDANQSLVAYFPDHTKAILVPELVEA
jgi:hypothetical protein